MSFTAKEGKSPLGSVQKASHSMVTSLYSSSVEQFPGLSLSPVFEGNRLFILENALRLGLSDTSWLHALCAFGAGTLGSGAVSSRPW